MFFYSYDLESSEGRLPRFESGKNLEGPLTKVRSYSFTSLFDFLMDHYGWSPLLKDTGGTSSSLGTTPPLLEPLFDGILVGGVPVVSTVFECPDPTQVFDALPYSSDGVSIDSDGAEELNNPWLSVTIAQPRAIRCYLDDLLDRQVVRVMEGSCDSASRNSSPPSSRALHGLTDGKSSIPRKLLLD